MRMGSPPATTSISSGVLTAVPFNVVDHDDGGWANIVEHSIVVPLTAWYVLMYGAYWASGGTGIFSVQVYDITSAVAIIVNDQQPGTSAQYSQQDGGVAYLTANHHYGVYVQQTTGSPVNVLAAAYTQLAIASI